MISPNLLTTSALEFVFVLHDTLGLAARVMLPHESGPMRIEILNNSIARRCKWLLASGGPKQVVLHSELLEPDSSPVEAHPSSAVEVVRSSQKA
jgi:hypothetical protein